MGLRQVAEKAGVARNWHVVRDSSRDQIRVQFHTASGTWALKPKSRFVTENAGKLAEVDNIGGGLTGKGKAAVAGTTVGVGGAGYGAKKKIEKSNNEKALTAAAFGIGAGAAFGGIAAHNHKTTGSWKGLAGKEGLKPTVTPKQYKAARGRYVQLAAEHKASKSVSKSAFGVEQVEKFDRGPKATYTVNHLHEQSPTGQKFHAATDAYIGYKGKSMILRRNKYHVNTEPSGKTLRGLDDKSRVYVEAHPPRRASKVSAQNIENAYNNKKAKTVKIKGQQYNVANRVSKSAFGVEHVSKAIKIPPAKPMNRAVANEKMKTMTGHLKRAAELGVKPKGK